MPSNPWEGATATEANPWDGPTTDVPAPAKKVKPAPPPPDISQRYAAEKANMGTNAKHLMSDLASDITAPGAPPTGFDPSKVMEGAVDSGIGMAGKAISGLAAAPGAVMGAIKGVLGGKPKEGDSSVFTPAADTQAQVEDSLMSAQPKPSPTSEYVQKVAAVPMSMAKTVGKATGGSWGRVLGDEAAGETIGDVAPELAATAMGKPEAKRAALTHKEGREAHIMDQGYQLPPNATPGRANSTISTVGKKDVIENHVILKNQKNTNRLAKKELGIPESQPLDEGTVIAQRAKLGKPYEEVKKLPFSAKQDATLQKQLKAIQEPDRLIQESFPGFKVANETAQDVGVVADAAKIKPAAAVELIKRLREDARHDLSRREISSAEKTTAMNKIKIADHLEDFVDRSVGGYLKTVKNTGVSPTLIKDLRTARREIAKSHNIQEATNLETGDVNATAIGNLRDKGVPLTGGLKTIAIARKVAPDVVKKTDGLRRANQFSYGDAGWAGAGAVAGALAHGAVSPATALGAAGAAAARPLASHIATTKAYQKNFVRPKGAVKGTDISRSLKMGAAEQTPWRKKEDQ